MEIFKTTNSTEIPGNPQNKQQKNAEGKKWQDISASTTFTQVFEVKFAEWKIWD